MNDLKKILSKTFPIVRDLLIFSAAIITIVFNYLSSPVREDIRTNIRNINAVEQSLSEHKQSNSDAFNRIDTGLDSIGTKIDGINTRLSRIEGKLEK